MRNASSKTMQCSADHICWRNETINIDFSRPCLGGIGLSGALTTKSLHRLYSTTSNVCKSIINAEHKAFIFVVFLAKVFVSVAECAHCFEIDFFRVIITGNFHELCCSIRYIASCEANHLRYE